MRRSVRRFSQKKRLLRLTTVNEDNEGFAKSVDLGRSGVRLRELQTRDRGYTIGVVARTTSRLLEHLKGALAERFVLSGERK
jgi:hypothetical protein